MLRQQQCDLVITDVDMPEMDGIEFTQQLRADAKLGRLPVIMVTSRDAEEYRQRGVAAGADAYVTKGAFDQHEVLGLVRRMIVHGRPAQALTSSRTPSAASDHA